MGKGLDVVFPCCKHSAHYGGADLFQKVSCPYCSSGEYRAAISLAPVFCFVDSNAVFYCERAKSGEAVFQLMGEAISSSSEGRNLLCDAIYDHLRICNTRISNGVSLVGIRSPSVTTLTGGAVFVQKTVKFLSSPSPGRFQAFLLIAAPPDLYGDMCRIAMSVSFASAMLVCARMVQKVGRRVGKRFCSANSSIEFEFSNDVGRSCPFFSMSRLIAWGQPSRLRF